MTDIQIKRHRAWLLFKIYFKTMLFAFTGGAVTVSIIQKELKKHALMDEDKVLEAYALAQSIPGAIAVNAGFFIGRELAGWLGVLAAVSATMLPALSSMLLITFFYDFLMKYHAVLGAINGIRAASVAVIAQIALSIIGVSIKSAFGIALILAAFILAFIFKTNIILIVLGCGAAGIIRDLIRSRGKR